VKGKETRGTSRWKRKADSSKHKGGFSDRGSENDAGKQQDAGSARESAKKDDAEIETLFHALGETTEILPPSTRV